jgi:hypothetical protein
MTVKYKPDSVSKFSVMVVEGDMCGVGSSAEALPEGNNKQIAPSAQATKIMIFLIARGL